VNWFWHALWICFVVIPATILWLVCIFDIVFRQRQMAVWKRIVWLIVVLVLPLFGALIYISVYARGMEEGFRIFERPHSQGEVTGDEYEAQRAHLEAPDRGW
jgi:Phospholipase_D-nuclease N-terminal